MAEIKRNIYTVVKTSDAKIYLTDTENDIFNLLLQDIEDGRVHDCKDVNEYWVCNQNEPYADKVLQVILDGEDEKAGVLKKPEIVCLCGSTRFFKTFDEQNFKLTLEGKIVLSIGCNTKSDEGLSLTDEDKKRLDELHKRKIDLCDSVLILNVGGYIGESTRSEINYAEKIGKPVSYLET